MSKIAPDHLGRQAFVYVQQSTQDQLLHIRDVEHHRGYAAPALIHQIPP